MLLFFVLSLFFLVRSSVLLCSVLCVTCTYVFLFVLRTCAAFFFAFLHEETASARHAAGSSWLLGCLAFLFVLDPGWYLMKKLSELSEYPTPYTLHPRPRPTCPPPATRHPCYVEGRGSGAAGQRVRLRDGVSRRLRHGGGGERGTTLRGAEAEGRHREGCPKGGLGEGKEGERQGGGGKRGRGGKEGTGRKGKGGEKGGVRGRVR